MRFIVCGSRHWTDREFVWRVLDKLHAKVGVTGIAEGSCRGVDRHARMWAKDRGVPVISFPADWSLGAKAGPLRNQQMADEYRPDGVVAIGMGRGTDSMVRIAQSRGIKVWEIARGKGGSGQKDGGGGN